MEFLSGGYYKATIHRVVQPPVDQRGYERLGVFYFCKADDDDEAFRTTSEHSCSQERVRIPSAEHSNEFETYLNGLAVEHITRRALLFNGSRDARIRFVDWLDAPRSFNTLSSLNHHHPPSGPHFGLVPLVYSSLAL